MASFWFKGRGSVQRIREPLCPQMSEGLAVSPFHPPPYPLVIGASLFQGFL